MCSPRSIFVTFKNLILCETRSFANEVNGLLSPCYTVPLCSILMKQTNSTSQAINHQTWKQSEKYFSKLHHYCIIKLRTNTNSINIKSTQRKIAACPPISTQTPSNPATHWKPIPTNSRPINSINSCSTITAQNAR